MANLGGKLIAFSIDSDWVYLKDIEKEGIMEKKKKRPSYQRHCKVHPKESAAFKAVRGFCGERLGVRFTCRECKYEKMLAQADNLIGDPFEEIEKEIERAIQGDSQ